MVTNPDPGAVLDLSRAPRGELVAAQLVASVGETGDLAERHYLELKGPPDLSSKENKQKVAKFILGAANRMPDRAAEAFEGYGVMIVGITREGIEGVPPVEMLALSQVIQPFLGATGPRWDIVRVPVPNSLNQVIVILVDPPELGQPPFLCRSSGQGLQDGRIYYRADGETREPTSDELDQLMARGAAKPTAPVELEVSIVGKVTPFVVDDERTLEKYLRRERQYLLDALPPPTPLPAATSAMVGNAVGIASGLRGVNSEVAGFATTIAKVQASLAAAQGMGRFMETEEPEKRTEAEYRKQIDEWERLFRQAWTQAVELFASMTLEPNEVTVVNQTKTFLHDVEVNLHLEGAVQAVEPEYASGDGPDWRDLKLPPPPRRWGPTRRRADWLGATNYPVNYAALSAATSYASSRPYVPPDTSWKSGGSVDVRTDVGDLRPEETYESGDAEAILVIRGEAPSTVHGTWRATARDYNEVFTGELEVGVADSATLTNLLRDFLGLE